MSRTVDSERDSFLQAVLKLIPSEVIAVFVFIQGVMPRLLAPQLVVSLLLVGMTPLYLRYAAGVKSRAQIVVSTLSLVVWIFALGQGPFRFVRSPFYEPWYGSVALALWTLVPPMFIARDEGKREGEARPEARPEEKRRSKPRQA